MQAVIAPTTSTSTTKRPALALAGRFAVPTDR